MGKYRNQTEEIFFELVRAGLWEKEVRLAPYGEVDYSEVLRLAEEQSVVGLVAAGLEKVVDMRVPQSVALQFVGQTLQIEQRNKAMNAFVAELFKVMGEAGVSAVLVKGQGVAQCYERPLWRASGDVDLLLDGENYEKAKTVLFPIADNVEGEEVMAKHQALNLKGFEVELHGRMPFFLSKRADKIIDDVLEDTTEKEGCRVWNMNDTEVRLPKVDNDIIIVFTHFLFHFFVEGVGLRQICDWCRLLYSYRDSLNGRLLESRIRKMGLISEWRAFYNLASRYLGMPHLDLYFMACDSRYDKKADRILELVLESGNFGHNKDLSYRVKYKGFSYKIVSLWRRFCDFWGVATIFPLDAPRFFVTYVTGKVK